MGKSNIFAKHYSRAEDGGYYNIQQIEAKKQNYENLLHQTDSPDGALLQGITQELQNLLILLEKQESNFYRRFGIAEKDLGLFNQRIEQWRLEMGHLLERKTAIEVCNIMSAVIKDADVQFALENYLNEPQEPLLKTEIIEEDLASFLNENFYTDSKGKRKKGSFSSAGKGINSTFKITNKDGKYTVSLSEGEMGKLTNYMKLKIIRTVNKGINEERQISTSVSSEVYEQIFERLSRGVDNTKMLMCLRDELINRKSEYTKFPHLPVIQGWLGEIYWNAAFSYITDSRFASLPTGSVLNTKNHQLSVDMIYKDAGFQIKNWSLNEFDQHKVTSLNKNFGNFLQDRADLLHTYVGQIIAQLFGSVSYNKPNVEYKEDKNYSYYEGVYEEIESLSKQIEPLTRIFYASLNKIIEIDNNNIIRDAFPAQSNIYYNTFWLIKDKIIPSSVIIKQLIKNIKSLSFQQGENGVRFSILSITEKDGGSQWPEEANFTNLAMANRWRISYEYVFDLPRLLQDALYQL